MANPAWNASRSLGTEAVATGSPGISIATSNRPAVDVTAVTTRDDFLLELGEAVGGQASVRPVDSIGEAEGKQKVWLSNRGSMTLPVELELTYADSTKERMRLPVEMWNLGPSFAYRVRGERRVVAAEVDPRRALPDTDRRNNRRNR